jgi:hypothetical protein
MSSGIEKGVIVDDAFFRGFVVDFRGQAVETMIWSHRGAPNNFFHALLGSVVKTTIGPKQKHENAKVTFQTGTEEVLVPLVHTWRFTKVPLMGLIR